jgi:peptide/nickel transport system ATP-binding protein
MPPPILTVNNLSIAFPTEDGKIQAVEQISLDLLPREVLAIVGESGSGATVTPGADQRRDFAAKGRWGD